MRYKDRTIKSVSDLLSALKAQTKPNVIVWFRGHARSNWSLVPSLSRKKKHLKAEAALIKRFMQNAVPHLNPPPSEEWEWMFLMQHHRAPTRLLDWTESPLAALYFVVTENQHHNKDGILWCLDPVALNKDVVNINFEFTNEIPAFGIDKIMESYLPNRLSLETAKLKPVAIVGPRNTARMAAQMGVFTINHADHTPIENLGSKHHVWRWLVPSTAKKKLSIELKHLGFTALTLFPELDRVADISKELLS